MRDRARAAAETRPDATNPGDSSGEATPVPIPNTEVKLSSAEDTERAAFRENRSSPGFLRSRGRAVRQSPRRSQAPALRWPGYPPVSMTAIDPRRGQPATDAPGSSPRPSTATTSALPLAADGGWRSVDAPRRSIAAGRCAARAACRREAAAAVPDRRPSDMRPLEATALRPREIRSPDERDRRRLRRGRMARTAPVVLDHGRLGVAVPAAARDRPAGQAALGRAHGRRLRGDRRSPGCPAAAPDGGPWPAPDPRRPRGDAARPRLPTPSPRRPPSTPAPSAAGVAGPVARPEPGAGRADLQGQARRHAQSASRRASGRPSEGAPTSTTSAHARPALARRPGACKIPCIARACGARRPSQSGSALAAAAVRGDEPAGLDLGDPRAAARARPVRPCRGPRGSRGPASRTSAGPVPAGPRSRRPASIASPRTGRRPPRRRGVERLRNGSSRAAWRISSL